MSNLLLSAKIASNVVFVWMVTTFIILLSLGFTSSEFVNFGPSDRLLFLGIKINTWGKWIAVCIYTFINQIVTTYGLETISPWMINIVQNREQKTITTGKLQTLFYINNWYAYMWMSRIFGIQLFLSQLDLMVLVLITDLLCTNYVTKKYLDEKIEVSDQNSYYNNSLREELSIV